LTRSEHWHDGHWASSSSRLFGPRRHRPQHTYAEDIEYPCPEVRLRTSTDKRMYLSFSFSTSHCRPRPRHSSTISRTLFCGPLLLRYVCCLMSARYNCWAYRDLDCFWIVSICLRAFRGCSGWLGMFLCFLTQGPGNSGPLVNITSVTGRFSPLKQPPTCTKP
jgi:hypothetical protein